MKTWMKNALMVAGATAMLAVSQTTWVLGQQTPPPVVCCVDGSACNPGQACCRKKSPAMPCSDDVQTQCVDSTSECGSGEENN